MTRGRLRSGIAMTLVGVVVAITAPGSGPTAASEPSGATAADIEQALSRTGLRITYREPRPGAGVVAVLGGVAVAPAGGRVGFEFAFAKRGDPSTKQLGTVGWPLEVTGH